jgi:hypothetical protein
MGFGASTAGYDSYSDPGSLGGFAFDAPNEQAPDPEQGGRLSSFLDSTLGALLPITPSGRPGASLGLMAGPVSLGIKGGLTAAANPAIGATIGEGFGTFNEIGDSMGGITKDDPGPVPSGPTENARMLSVVDDPQPSVLFQAAESATGRAARPEGYSWLLDLMGEPIGAADDGPLITSTTTADPAAPPAPQRRSLVPLFLLLGGLFLGA